MAAEHQDKAGSSEVPAEKPQLKAKAPPPRWTAPAASSAVYMANIPDEAVDDCYLKFGKHKGARFIHVFKTDPGYCSWCLAHLRGSTPNHCAWLTYLQDNVKPSKPKSEDDEGWEEVDRAGQHWKERIEFIEEQLKTDKMGNTSRGRLEMLEKETQELRDINRELNNNMFEMSQRYLALEGHIAQLTTWLANQGSASTA